MTPFAKSNSSKVRCDVTCGVTGELSGNAGEGHSSVRINLNLVGMGGGMG